MANDNKGLILGLAFLGVAGVGTYFYLKSQGIDILKRASAGASGGSGGGIANIVGGGEPIGVLSGSSDGIASQTQTSTSGISSSSSFAGTPVFNAQGQVAVFDSGGRGVIIDRSSGQGVASTTPEIFKPVGSSAILQSIATPIQSVAPTSIPKTTVVSQIKTRVSSGINRAKGLISRVF